MVYPDPFLELKISGPRLDCIILPVAIGFSVGICMADHVAGFSRVSFAAVTEIQNDIGSFTDIGNTECYRLFLHRPCLGYKGRICNKSIIIPVTAVQCSGKQNNPGKEAGRPDQSKKIISIVIHDIKC